jgi:hypothetical protein
MSTLGRFAEKSDAWKETEIDRRIMGEIRGLLNNYLAHVLGHRPRMRKFLGILEAGM